MYKGLISLWLFNWDWSTANNIRSKHLTVFLNVNDNAQTWECIEYKMYETVSIYNILQFERENNNPVNNKPI